MGRLRKKPWADDYLKKSKIVITNPIEYKDRWDKLFNNSNPLWIEIGIGRGDFTLSQARLNKKVNILGIEKFSSVQVIPVKRAEEEGIKNLKFILGDAQNITEWFKKDSIDRIFINFPDPWPKERHEKRRLLFRDFLNMYYVILKNEAHIEFKTDQLKLFEFVINEIKNETKFKIFHKSKDLHKENKSVIKTEYENKFLNMGNKIFYLDFKK